MMMMMMVCAELSLNEVYVCPNDVLKDKFGVGLQLVSLRSNGCGCCGADARGH